MQPKTTRKTRPSLVCNHCKAQKLRCDRVHPKCGRCRRIGKDCSYGNSTERAPEIVMALSTPPNALPKAPKVQETTVKESNNTTNIIVPTVAAVEQQKIGIVGPPPAMVALPPRTISNPTDAPSVQSSTGGSVFSMSPNVQSTAISPESADYRKDPGNINYTFDGKLEVWDINKQFLSHGYHTYVDLPYATHSIAQHDPYLRFFCPSVHGTTLTDLQSRLEFIKNSGGSTSVNNDVLKTLHEISPLMFIEDAVVKWVTQTNDNVNNQLPWEYFNTIFTIEDRMHPTLVSTINKLVVEIEMLLPQKGEIHDLLRHFYSNIYPFYPLLEIPLFEEALTKILIDDGSSMSYRIQIFQENIRVHLENLTLFLIIISIAMRDPNITVKSSESNAAQGTETSKRLLLLSQKLLSLLNGFKYTTENVLCCSLYLLITEILNPGNAEEHITHNTILTLKCLTDMAYTLGLHEEPSQFTRYHNRTQKSAPFFQYRRKLWIGLQSLRLEIMTADGGCQESDYEYLETFINNGQSSIPSFIEHFNSSTSVDRKIFSIQDNMYQFQMLLNRVMVTCGPQCNNPNISHMMQSIERLKEFTFRKFPLSKLTHQNNSHILNIKEWRDASFDLLSIEKLQIFRVNIIFFSGMMNIFYMIALHFEKKCCQELETYESTYHTFFLHCFDTYLELTTLIKKYLDNEYKMAILPIHEYCINKSVAYVVIKVQSIQLGNILRLCYKSSIIRSKDVPNKYSYLLRNDIAESSTMESLTIVTDQIKKHIGGLIQSMLNRYGDTYFGCYQVMLMGKYIHYMVDNNMLTKITNQYWEKASETDEIPSKILDMMKLKWGLGPLDINVISYYSTNPIALAGFNKNLLDSMLNALENARIYDNLTVVPAIPEISSNEQEVLQQLMQTNFELFSGIIGDSLGTLPVI